MFDLSLWRRIWGPLAAVALVWPARLAGPLDGAPLDGAVEAIVVGLVFPVLWWFHPRFLESRLARFCILALLAWKALTAATLVQDGWCVRFVPGAPLVMDATGAPHSWDVRADWRSPDPACSAVMTRPYRQLFEFPAWFFNLPPPNDSWPGPRDRPPGATVGMTVDGFLHTADTGLLRIVFGPDLAVGMHVDGKPVSREEVERGGLILMRGVHTISVNATLTGDRWRFEPLWNSEDLWSESMATLRRPAAFDLAVRPWGKWVGALFAALFGLAWLASAAARIRDADILTWTIGASLWIGVLTAMGYDEIVRWSVAGLAGAALVKVPTRLRNVLGAFALIGIPWLTLVVVSGVPDIGRFRLYDVGNDYWMYQRFAYRIVMQGYWLQGGAATFWFQPFYRWIAGVLHLAFGDSSVGERFWDGGCLLAMALFAFHVTKAFAGFRWGIGAAVTTLAVFTLGITWRFIGLGLSEISSAGFMYLAALVALQSRHRNWICAITAGVLATLAFFTRLNNFPMAVGVAVFALPIAQPAKTAFWPSTWMSRAAWRTAAGVSAALSAGLLLLAWRNWLYTGVFSPFHGTTRHFQAVWQPGMSLQTYLQAMGSSVLMHLTMNDPPRFDLRALPIVAGAFASVGALAGVPRLRELPLAPVLFSLAGISGSLIGRGVAYPGRFSIHLIGVTSAVVTCAAAVLVLPRPRRKSIVPGS